MEVKPGQVVYTDGEYLEEVNAAYKRLYERTSLMGLWSRSEKERKAFKDGYESGIQVGASSPILHHDSQKNVVGRCGYCGHNLVEGRVFQQVALREIKCSNCGASPAPMRMLDRRVGERRGQEQKPKPESAREFLERSAARRKNATGR